ncbi:MAG: hypothetical protein R2707_10800 [Acidimicrobiales bacterium]
MTLEDQIRRMGEARASVISTPTWRDHVGGGRGLPWRWAGAAVAILVLAVGAFAVLPGDDPDTDVAGPESARRWIPASGVERIDYPGELAFVAGFLAWPEVALVTPDARTDVAVDDITRLFGGSTPYRRNTVPADGFSVSTRNDGVVAVSFTRGGDEDLVASIETRRFSAQDLERRAAELLGVTTDLAALADAVASWDDALAVAYVGEPVPIEASISADETFDEAVFWLHTASAGQFLATNGGERPGWFDELLALESTDDHALTEEYFGSVGAGPVVGVTDAEWLLIVDDVLGPDPQVEFPGSELLFAAPGAPEVATPAAEPARTEDGAWTLALRFDEPTSFRDGGAVVATIGGVTLTFGFAEPGMTFTELTVPTRMLEAEARSYAELINDALADPAPTATTTTDPYPTTGPSQSGVCAANPVPSDDVLDLAAHIAFDRSPLDLDQDGVDDEMLVYDDADGNWFLLARLQAGWTNALDLGTPPEVPGLARTSDGVPAGTDLDDDGGLEFFVTGYLGPSAGMVTLRGCELVDEFFLDEPAEGIGATFGVQIGLSPDIPLCQGRACATRVRCVDDVLTQELFVGVAVNDDSGYWTTVELRLDPSGMIISNELPTRPVGPFETLDDPPTEATTGVIDCVP